MTKPRLPTGQGWFIERAQQLGRTSKLGVCAGVAGAGVPAILMRDLPTFDRRLFAINNIGVKQFRQTIDDLKRERILITTEAKNYIRYYLPDKKTFAEKMNEVLNDPATQKKITALNNTLQELINEGKLQETQKNEEWVKRQKLIITNALFQKE